MEPASTRQLRPASHLCTALQWRQHGPAQHSRQLHGLVTLSMQHSKLQPARRCSVLQRHQRRAAGLMMCGCFKLPACQSICGLQSTYLPGEVDSAQFCRAQHSPMATYRCADSLVSYLSHCVESIMLAAESCSCPSMSLPWPRSHWHVTLQAAKRSLPRWKLLRECLPHRQSDRQPCWPLTWQPVTQRSLQASMIHGCMSRVVATCGAGQRLWPAP